MGIQRSVLLGVCLLLGIVFFLNLVSFNASAGIALGEVSDEGDPGSDQFVEIFNPEQGGAEDLSQYYLSLEENPSGVGDEFGLYDLTSYDDDGLLEDDEFLVVTSDQHDLGEYKGMGIYWKSNNSLVSEVRWSYNGLAPDPVSGLSAQLPWDSEKKEYLFGSWTLGPATKENRFAGPVPDFGKGDVVINEVNEGFVELFNRGSGSADLGGYQLCGVRKAHTIPGGTVLEPRDFLEIDGSELDIGTQEEGGDVKLLDDQGVLVDLISYDPNGPGEAGHSIVSRHFDGIGPRGVYQQDEAWGWDVADQENEWWEFEAPESEGSSNYLGTSILIDEVGVFDYLNASLNPYKDGILKADVANTNYLEEWDIVMYQGALNSAVVPRLTDYLDDGGRLYLECDDFMDAAANEEDFYDMLFIKVKTFTAGAIGDNDLAGDSFARDIQLAYNPSTPVWERIDPSGDGGMRAMYMESDSNYRFVASYIENPTTAYRVVSSALEYEEMTDSGNLPGDYLDAMLEWFLDPNLNNEPAITLLEGQVGTTSLVNDNDRISTLGWLGWSNDDVDYWDQELWMAQDVNGHDQYKFMEFTVYLDTDEEKVEEYDPACEVVATVNTTFYLPEDLEPGQYFWTVTARDRFDVFGAALDVDEEPVVFSFYYDDTKPVMESVKPYFKSSRGVSNVGPEMIDFYTQNGFHPTFGPEGQGKPEGIIFNAADQHLGLSFTELEKTELGLSFISFDPKVEGKSWQLGDVDILATTGGPMDSENGANEANFIMDVPEYVLDGEGTLLNGRYTVHFRLVDFVANYIEHSVTFTIDAEAPDKVEGLVVSAIDHPIYLNTGVQYLKGDETYKLTGVGPTTAADGTLSRVEFTMADKLYNPHEEQIGSFQGIDVSGTSETKEYSTEFTATRDYQYFYAISYDRAGNYARSDILSGVVVDDYAPTKPYNIAATAGSDEYVIVSGWVRDSLVQGKTSGMSYVLVYMNGEVVTHENGGIYYWLDNQPYEAGDEMKVPVLSNRFSVSVPLLPISTNTGDVRHVIQARGVDNVGNIGELSDPGELVVRSVAALESKHVTMLEEVEDLSEEEDHLSGLEVRFLHFREGDNSYYLLRTRYQNQTPEAEEPYVFLNGSWLLDYSGDPGGFEAEIILEIHLGEEGKNNFQHTQILRRENSGSPWEELEGLQRVHIEKNVTSGEPEHYFLVVTVDGFSQYSVAVRIPVDPPVVHIDSFLPVLIEDGDSLDLLVSGKTSEVEFFVLYSDIDGEVYNGSEVDIAIDMLSIDKHVFTLSAMAKNGIWFEVENFTLEVIHPYPESRIITITPNPASEGEEILFQGKLLQGLQGGDFRWFSSLDGFIYIGPNATFSTVELSPGKHDIQLSYREESGRTSNSVNLTLVVEKKEAGGDDNGNFLFENLGPLPFFSYLILVLVLVVLGLVLAARRKERTAPGELGNNEDGLPLGPGSHPSQQGVSGIPPPSLMAPATPPRFQGQGPGSQGPGGYNAPGSQSTQNYPFFTPTPGTWPPPTPSSQPSASMPGHYRCQACSKEVEEKNSFCIFCGAKKI